MRLPLYLSLCFRCWVKLHGPQYRRQLEVLCAIHRLLGCARSANVFMRTLTDGLNTRGGQQHLLARGST